LAGTEVDQVVVVGITGAIHDETPLGTLLRPETVIDGATGTGYRPHPLGAGTPRGALWTSDRLITDPETLAGLRRDGVVALDMETAAIAAVCERVGVPWSVFRAFSDRATDGSIDDEVFQMSNQDGTPDPKAVAAFVARHPGRIPAMARMAKSARLACRRAAEEAIAAVAAEDAPSPGASG
jgi:adenosylhomocysteine nucleosidase